MTGRARTKGAAFGSFRDLLDSFATTAELNRGDRAHLRRWWDDGRANEEWDKIFRVAREHGKLVLPNLFIREILTARPVAEAISARGKYRWRHRAWAQKMEILADFLEEPRADGMPPVFPRSRELAKMLRIAAQAYRGHVEATRYTPGVIRVSREAGAAEIFASQVSHYLKEVTGLWLDDQVAVLTEIAFPDVGDVDPEHVKRLRRSR